jgi:hypothetical protein
MRWPVNITTPEGVEKAYAVSSKMQPDGLTTIVQLEDGRLFKRTHGHVLHAVEDDVSSSPNPAPGATTEGRRPRKALGAG